MGLSVWAFPNTVDPRSLDLPDCAGDAETILAWVTSGELAEALRRPEAGLGDRGEGGRP